MKGHVDEGALLDLKSDFTLTLGYLNPALINPALDIKRQSVIACAYCIIVVEYDSKETMWCKMLRG